MGPRWLPDGRRESGRIAALAVSCPSLLNYLKPRIVPEGGEREREREGGGGDVARSLVRVRSQLRARHKSLNCYAPCAHAGKRGTPVGVAAAHVALARADRICEQITLGLRVQENVCSSTGEVVGAKAGSSAQACLRTPGINTFKTKDSPCSTLSHSYTSSLSHSYTSSPCQLLRECAFISHTNCASNADQMAH